MTPPSTERVTLGPVRLRSPLMIAAGCAGIGPELARFGDLSQLGAVVSPTVFVEDTPWPPAAVTDSGAGLIRSCVPWGIGVQQFTGGPLTWLKDHDVRVIVSIGGVSAGDAAEVAGRLRMSRGFDAVLGVEINATLPQRGTEGVWYDEEPAAAARLVARVREKLPSDVAVLARVSPPEALRLAVVRAVVNGGADAVVLHPAHVVDHLEPGVDEALAGAVGAGPVPGERRAQLCGAPLLPGSLRAIRQVTAAMTQGRVPRAPVIAVGGVGTAEAAQRLLDAGAVAVQVGSITLTSPTAPWQIHESLREQEKR